MGVKLEHLGTTIGRQKVRRWLKIIAWIFVGLFIVYLGLGFLVVTAFRSSHYNLSHSMTIAAAVTNAIAPAFAYQYDPYVGPIFDWPPRYGLLPVPRTPSLGVL